MKFESTKKVNESWSYKFGYIVSKFSFNPTHNLSLIVQFYHMEGLYEAACFIWVWNFIATETHFGAATQDWFLSL